VDNQNEKIVNKSSAYLRLSILFVTVLIITFMFPAGESLESNVQVNGIWLDDDLISTIKFPILKEPEEYQRELQEAAEKVYPVFIHNKEIAKTNIDSFDNYNRKLLQSIDYQLKTKESEKFNPTFLTDPSYEEFKRLRLHENRISTSKNISLNKIFTTAKSLFKRFYRRGILSLNYNQIPKDTISIREGKFEYSKPAVAYYDMESVKSEIADAFVKIIKNEETQRAVLEYVYHFITPNIIYSQELTDESVKLAKEAVVNNKGFVQENERIVSKHELITPLTKLKIESYRKAKGTKVGFIYQLEQRVGEFLHILLVLLPFIIYIYLFRKRIYYDASKILLISISILFVSGLAFLVSMMDVAAPVEYLILIPIISMLMTIVFDSRIGFYNTVVIALIIGGLRGNDYVFAVMNIVAGGLAAYSVRDMKNRTQIFRSFIFILVGYVLSIIAFGFERFEAWDQILISASFAAVNALISPAFTYGIIIFVEKFFNITTELTLLELSDFNNPLLRELAKKAPGTFTHSMTIGSLVESAAEEIGANPILARVGAYYHDVGKTLHPEEFVENQMNDVNIHEEMDPRISAKHIIEHVTRGIDLAKEAKLPQVIIDFIPEHHGTMLVQYFYEKAVEKYGKENVNEEEFRYKGPKPHSKETALLMLADACESASRSIEEFEPQKVENMINHIFKTRMEDGQLDESPITLRDLNKIKEAFLTIIVGQHHKRIRYPNQDQIEKEEPEDSNEKSE
jgi:putative nucleotidyltransferase with HDIG domain